MVPTTDLLQGTLDLLLLKILTLGPNHGCGIANRMKQIARDGLTPARARCIRTPSAHCARRPASPSSPY